MATIVFTSFWMDCDLPQDVHVHPTLRDAMRFCQEEYNKGKEPDWPVTMLEWTGAGCGTFTCRYDNGPAYIVRTELHE